MDNVHERTDEEELIEAGRLVNVMANRFQGALENVQTLGVAVNHAIGNFQSRAEKVRDNLNSDQISLNSQKLD